MSRLQSTRHDSRHRPGYRVRLEHSFFAYATTRRGHRKWLMLTKEEQDAIVTQMLIAQGFVSCRGCGRCWLDADLDAKAQRVGVSVVRTGEAGLERCPRCALGESLVALLTRRLTALTSDQNH